MNQSNKKTVVVICGPTGVGKTAVAIQVAKYFNTSIISADSRQCYKELNIGVARPSVEELKQVPHYFIASHSIKEELTAADFENYAIQEAERLFAKNETVVMAGGTGLYIKAFCEGLDSIPSIDPGIRNAIIKNYEAKGIDWLQNEMRVKDPGFYETGEIQNPQRMMRALEVFEATGQSILSFRKGDKASRNFSVVKIGLELPREELNELINKRVDLMMQSGLLKEAQELLPHQHLNALQTVGYAELFDHLEGKTSLEDAIDLIKVHTRQYAKRQMTWFKKDTGIAWFAPSMEKEIISFLENNL